MSKIACINCRAPLNIVAEMDEFQCGHCGIPLQVVRDGDQVALARQSAAGRHTAFQSPWQGPTAATSADRPTLHDQAQALQARAEVEQRLQDLCTQRDAQMKEAGSAGFGWLVLITFLSMFLVQWGAVVVFMVGLVFFVAKADKRKKAIAAEYTPHITPLVVEHARLTVLVGDHKPLPPTGNAAGATPGASGPAPAANSGPSPAAMAGGVVGALLAAQALAQATQANADRTSSWSKRTDDDQPEPLEIELGSPIVLGSNDDAPTSDSTDTSTADSGFGIDTSSRDEW